MHALDDHQDVISVRFLRVFGCHLKFSFTTVASHPESCFTPSPTRTRPGGDMARFLERLVKSCGVGSEGRVSAPLRLVLLIGFLVLGGAALSQSAGGIPSGSAARPVATTGGGSRPSTSG